MEPVIVPEPTEGEREALLAALRESEDGRIESGWLEAALREGVATEEPA